MFALSQVRSTESSPDGLGVVKGQGQHLSA